MLSLLKTEKTLDFTDRVKKWGEEEGGEKKAATTLPYSQKKKSYFNICILDSSILPLNHVKTQEENIKANEKEKKNKIKRQLSISIQKPRIKSLSR